MTRRSFIKSLISTLATATLPVAPFIIGNDGEKVLVLLNDEGRYHTIDEIEEEITRMMAKQFSEDLDREFIGGLGDGKTIRINNKL